MTQIIKVPDELRGQKIVPFMEFLDVKKIDKYVLPYNAWNGNDTIYLGTKKYQELRDFYSQPFSVDMLVNPYPQHVKGMDLTNSKETFTLLHPDWQQAEEVRLFEGWEKWQQISDDCVVNLKSQSIKVILRGNGWNIQNGSSEFLIKSLNDFITLCQLADVDLGVWK